MYAFCTQQEELVHGRDVCGGEGVGGMLLALRGALYRLVVVLAQENVCSSYGAKLGMMFP